MNNTTSNIVVLKQVLAALSAGDADAYCELLSDDYVIEAPLQRPEPLRIEGKAAVKEAMRQFFQGIRTKITLGEVHELANGDLIAEYTGDITIVPTGRQLKNQYIALWRFAHGKITFTREYYDTAVSAQIAADFSKHRV